MTSFIAKSLGFHHSQSCASKVIASRYASAPFLQVKGVPARSCAPSVRPSRGLHAELRMLSSPRRGVVRCLGWEKPAPSRPALRCDHAIPPADGTPFEVVDHASGSHPPLWRPVQPSLPQSHDDLIPTSPLLRICIFVVQADAESNENTENNPRHHVLSAGNKVPTGACRRSTPRFAAK